MNTILVMFSLFNYILISIAGMALAWYMVKFIWNNMNAEEKPWVYAYLGGFAVTTVVSFIMMSHPSLQLLLIVISLVMMYVTSKIVQLMFRMTDDKTLKFALKAILLIPWLIHLAETKYHENQALKFEILNSQVAKETEVVEPDNVEEVAAKETEVAAKETEVAKEGTTPPNV